MKTIAAFMLVLCHLAFSRAWQCKEVLGLHHVTQIDAGLGLVVVTDKYHHSYLLTGSSWYSLPEAGLRHVTVGHAGIWGVDTKSKIVRLEAGTWASVPGSMTQVDAGGNAFAVGVSRNYNSFCLSNSFTWGLNTVGRFPWTRFQKALTYYSCGFYGCWGVDAAYRVYFTRHVSPFTCFNPHWTLITGLHFKIIEVGSDGSVFGVTVSGKVYQRTGVSTSAPFGLSWTHVPICVSIRHVSYDLGYLWVVSHSGLVLKCTKPAVVLPPGPVLPLLPELPELPVLQ